MATTNAERQKKYREKQRKNGNEKQLNIWISLEAALALEQMARTGRVFMREMLENLIFSAAEEDKHISKRRKKKAE